MLHKKSILLLLLLFNFSFSNAQKFELGKVNQNELQEKFCPSDTNAVAAILYNKAKTFFIYEKEGFYINHVYEFRIKIYKKNGLSWANFKVPYYTGYKDINKDVVKFSDCITYNLEKGTIIKTKLKNEGNFDTKLNEFWWEAAITLPNVKVGSVIEFKYTIRSENEVKFPVFNFQYSIPVNYSEYITEIPEFYIYKPIFTGFKNIKSESKVGFGYQNYADEHNQGLHMSYKQINSSHIAENVPALKEEPYVDNIQNYKLSVDYELEKTRFPEVPEVLYTQSWEDVVKNIYKDENYGKQLLENTFLLPDLRSILKDNLTESEKANIIFKFVQNKMNWNNFYGYSTDKGVKKAYEDGTGNIAEINFILISMLNYAGINANPVLLSTINHGIPIYPNRTVFNYVIATADIDGKQILMDATNKKTTLDILPFNTLNWIGRLIRQDGTSEEVNLAPKTLSKETNNIIATIDKQGIISGVYRAQKSDYEALRFRENNADLNKENYLEKVENNWKGIQIKEYVIENNLTDLTKPVVQTFTFTTDNEVDIIADKMYIDPLLFLTSTTNPFIQEKRELPIYYGYPIQEKYNIGITIPEGYSIESIPKSITITTPENICVFSFKIIASENKIQIAASSEINAAILSSTFYDDLKSFYQKMIDKQNEKIALKRM